MFQKVRLLANSARLLFHKIPSLLTQGHSTLSWRLTSKHLTNEVARVTAELRKYGIATSSVQKLGVDVNLFHELCDASIALANSPEARERGGNTECDGARKDFFFQLLGRDVINIDQQTVFSRVALHPSTLAVASSYLDCFARLTNINVWLNIPTNDDPHTSQLWHRDPGDITMLKMFVMISELGPENGAFSYIPGSHWHGERASLSPPIIYEGLVPRTLDSQMREVVPDSEWSVLTGGPGTIVFADTRGLHKGGFVIKGQRLLFMSFYTRWLSTNGRTVRVNYLGDQANSPAARWAAKW